MAITAAEMLNELKAYHFFSAFPEDLLNHLVKMTQPVSFRAGQEILSQGNANDSLFFLRSGNIQVIVDGELVAELSEPGEVIGEMSIISHKPVAATVTAATDVELFKVGSSGLQGLSADEMSKLHNLLFQVYASILSDRLAKTNDKAKRFEIANRDLLQAHAELKKLNRNLESEIARRSKEIVQKVQSLTVSHLFPAQRIASQLVSQTDPNQQPPAELSTLLLTINEVVDFLKPIADLSTRAQGVTSRRVLLIDQNKKQQNIAKLALGGTGVELTAISGADDLDQVKDKDYDLILCDVELRSLVSTIKAGRWKNVPLVLLMNLDMMTYLEVLRDYPRIEHVVSRNLDNRTFTIKNVSTTVAKILNNDFFGLEKYLAWGAQVFERRVNDSEKRLEYIDEMKDFFTSIGIRSTFLDRAHLVAEEMLMNAIYDAPMDKNGKPLFNHLPRTTAVHLLDDQAAKLRYASDGVLLGVSVSDPFGVLTKEIVMKYLESCYSGQAGTLNQGKGGAGRGLHMIIENSDLVIFNVKRGVQTEVISMFNLERSNSEEPKPTFHLFFTN